MVIEVGSLAVVDLEQPVPVASLLLSDAIAVDVVIAEAGVDDTTGVVYGLITLESAA